jgi:Ca2+-binding EF-hand superfamily protein
MDTNGDGDIDEQEFKEGMKHLDVGLSPVQVEEMMSAFDLDGNGRLDVEEFIDALQAYKEAFKHEENHHIK